MGCTSSNLLNQSDDFGCHHHFVKLTSTTYGLLNLDHPLPPPPPSSSAPPAPMTPPERFTISGKDPIKNSEPPEVINFWELMSGLDSTADDDDASRSSVKRSNGGGGGGGVKKNKENSDPNWMNPRNDDVLKPLDPEENRVVIYTTSLRGVRRTFEECNAVRAAIESFGVVVCERDVSMDRGFREELASLVPGEEGPVLPPRVFVKGRYIGGAEEVMRLVEEGSLGDLLRGVRRKKDRGGGGGGGGCDGCGGLRFLPCAECSGSCKVVEGWGSDAVVVRCSNCNENGLVCCPICS